jgi:hypothetical protein
MKDTHPDNNGNAMAPANAPRESFIALLVYRCKAAPSQDTGKVVGRELVFVGLSRARIASGT